jgi:proteasome assembly chaperone (PAC2) family protein
MADSLELLEIPNTADEVYMLAGWRQWVDGGSISSGLPKYLSKQAKSRKIGEIKPGDYYLFQLPVTQDLMRPIVKHNHGHTEFLQTRRNEFYYAEMGKKGIVYFIGEEPHMNIESYVQTLLDAAQQLNVKRIVMFGGIYAEVPYNRDRFVSSIYSLKSMKKEVRDLSVNLSDYQGGASIGSYLTKRAGERDVEVVGFYTFSPLFHMAGREKISESIQIGNDYKAWLDVMERVVHMLGLEYDLTDLQNKSADLIKDLDKKLQDLALKHPDLDIGDYVKRISEDFNETNFSPLEDVWEDELRKLGDQFDLPDD